MKKYIKPAAEAMEVETQHLLADSDSMNYTTSPAKQGAGDGYSDGLVKEENSSFWE